MIRWFNYAEIIIKYSFKKANELNCKIRKYKKKKKKHYGKHALNIDEFNLKEKFIFSASFHEFH